MRERRRDAGAATRCGSGDRKVRTGRPSPSATMGRMHARRRRIGPHLPLGRGMVRAADRAHEIGASAVQIFTDNPGSWRRRAAPPTHLDDFRSRLVRHDVAPLVIHAAYLVNLAGPADDLFDRSVALLTSELTIAPSFGAGFVNVHTGSHRDTSLDAGIERVAVGIERVLAEVPSDGPILVLENSVGAGFAVGASIPELADIAEAIAARGVDRRRVAFCLDTSHLWGSGHRISEPDEVDRVIADFDARIGIDRLALVHLNDAKMGLGSKQDRHEHLGEGRIGERGLGHLLRLPQLGHVTFLLETPGMDAGFDAVNVARALALLAGEPLSDLPSVADAVASDPAGSDPAGSDPAASGLPAEDGVVA